MGEWAIVIVHCFFGSLLQIWSFRNRLVCYFCMLPARLEEEGGQEKRKEKKEKERRGKKNARDEGKMTQKKEKKVEEGEKPRGIAKSPISSRFFFFYSLTKREAARCLFPAPPPPFRNMPILMFLLGLFCGGS